MSSSEESAHPSRPTPGHRTEKEQATQNLQRQGKQETEDIQGKTKAPATSSKPTKAPSAQRKDKTKTYHDFEVYNDVCKSLFKQIRLFEKKNPNLNYHSVFDELLNRARWGVLASYTTCRDHKMEDCKEEVLSEATKLYKAEKNRMNMAAESYHPTPKMLAPHGFIPAPPFVGYGGNDPLTMFAFLPVGGSLPTTVPINPEAQFAQGLIPSGQTKQRNWNGQAKERKDPKMKFKEPELSSSSSTDNPDKKILKHQEKEAKRQREQMLGKKDGKEKRQH